MILARLLRYALNVIGSVIFGVDVDTISNPTHAFRTIEKRINNSDLINVIKGASVFLCPKYARLKELCC